MRLAARQKGFTLLGFILTMSLVISVIAGAGVYMVEKFGESGATQLGVRMAEYNGAVGRYIQENVATITSNASYSGIAWLQNSSCGGGAVSDYLPCAYPSSLPFDLAYQTAITVSGSDITATVTYGPGSLQFRGKWRLDFAETAKNKAVENQIGGLRLSQNFVVTASKILQSTVSTVGASEPWLRIDGSNSPTANIDWNNKSITNLDCIDFGDGNICTNGTGYMTITAAGSVQVSNALVAKNVYAQSFIDSNDNNFKLDPNGTSRLNYADLNYARLSNDYVEGTGCTTEQIGTTSTGELMSCVSGVWKKPGGTGPTCSFSAAANYCKWDTGLIQQWGEITAVNGTNLLISLPTAFSNTQYVVETNIYNTTNNAGIAAKEGSVFPRSKSTTAFYIRTGPDTLYYGNKLYWRAIGR